MDISRVLYLCEFKIKANTIQDTVEFPSFDQYLSEVVSDENPMDGQGQKPSPAPAPAPQRPEPAPMASQTPQQPAPAPQQPSPAPAPPVNPEPAPAPVQDKPEEEVALMGIEAQIKKTDDIIQKLELINSKISSLEQSNAKTIQDIKQELNPSLDSQLDKVASKSYPFNVKLDDYFGYEKEEPQQKLEITTDDIENYSDEEVKDSFNI